MTSPSYSPVRRQFRRIHLRLPALAASASLWVFAGAAQAQLLYTEDFNTNGEGTRYFSEGQGVVNKNGQVVPVPGGPSYWARNTDVVAKGEVVGVPFPAPAKRAVMLFNHQLDPGFLTGDGKKLIDATIKWLTDGKAKMTVMFSQPGNFDALGDGYLNQILTDAGHTVIADDTSVPTVNAFITANNVDLVINSSTGGDPIRLAGANKPMLSFAGDLIGDLLLATRGDVDLNFDPGDVKIEVASHPIAAGLPATLKFVTEAQPFDTIGLGLPPGSTTVASYEFTNPEGGVSKRPFLVTTDAGVQLLGGLISGMEGSGYWAGADINEPNVSTPRDDPARTGQLAGRSLTLKPVNVTGKPKLKLTFLLAGTEVDFDGPGGDDYFSIKVDINNTGEFVELARYGSPSGSEKFLVEMIKGGDGMGGPPDLVIPDRTKRIGIVAKDVTYDIPDGATDLVVRFEGLSTFWNEIMAFDNIRITSGDIVVPPLSNTTVTRSGDTLTFAWTGGAPPFALQYKSALGNTWADIATTSLRSVSLPAAGPAGFFRVQTASTKNVQLFRATLTGAAERPTPTDSTATGSGWLALDGTTATYAVSYSGLKGNANNAHIHGPADETVGAGVMFGITGALGSTFGTFSGVQTALTAQQVADIVAGKTYFNIHSAVFGGGEIRGQIKP